MNTPQPRIAVLILGYNHRAFLEDVLRSAVAQSYAPYEVRYIDNASSDGSWQWVREHFPNIRTERNEQNLGYAGGYGKALQEVFREGFDAAVLLNPDVVVESDWLLELQRTAFSDPRIAFVQPKVLLWQKKPRRFFNSSGNRIHFLGFGFCGGYLDEDIPGLASDTEVTYPSGSSLFIKREVYAALSGLDERYFAYLEDQDLAWQARLQGYKHMLSTRSVLWHKYDFAKKSIGNHFKYYLLERNRLFFITKFYSGRTLGLLFPAFVLMEIGGLGNAFLKGCLLAKLRSYRDFVKELPSMLRSRKAIQRSRKVSDRELFRFLSPTIDFAEIDSIPLRIANVIFKAYYLLIRKWI